MGITAILISITAVQVILRNLIMGCLFYTEKKITSVCCFRLQVLINLENPKVLIQITNFTLGQIFHLYLNSIPGQKLIDHSLKIHTFMCV